MPSHPRSDDPAGAEPPARKRGPMDVEREHAILAQVQRGELREALIELMGLYGAPIYAYCCRVLRDEVLAQDVQQVVFLHVYRDLPKFRGDSSLWSWIAQIAHNRCMDAATRRRRDQQRTVSLDGDDPVELPDAKAEDPTITPERIRRLKALERCLQRLSEPVRASLLVKYQFDHTFEEMSAILGERAGTLQVRVSRALPLLRRCLERAGITL